VTRSAASFNSFPNFSTRWSERPLFSGDQVSRFVFQHFSPDPVSILMQFGNRAFSNYTNLQPLWAEENRAKNGIGRREKLGSENGES
jgi:hypothetical protein